MPDLDHLRAEIERMRVQVSRQRKEILQLQRAGISTASAELLLGRMHVKIEGMCAERDRLKRKAKPDAPTYRSGKRILGKPAYRRM